MSDDIVIEGDLFIGDATYIKGKWVRERDYADSERISSARAEEIQRLHEEVNSLRNALREAQPPKVAMVIESHADEGLDYVKRVIASHWTPAGIHITIAP